MQSPNSQNLGKRSSPFNDTLDSARPQISKGSSVRLRKKKASSQSASNWKSADDELLREAVKTHGDSNWKKISKLVAGKNEEQCMIRWEKFLKPSSKKGPWSNNEDELLKSWVLLRGPGNWTECAKQIQGRSGKQCRERWVNALDPKVKRGNWTKEEQSLIFEMMKQYLTSWSSISKGIAGRTENSIKNYFYSTIRRIQATQGLKFAHQIARGEFNDPPSLASFEDSLDQEKLNSLGKQILVFLYKNAETSEKDNQYFQLLLKAITEEKKRKFNGKIKGDKGNKGNKKGGKSKKKNIQNNKSISKIKPGQKLMLPPLDKLELDRQDADDVKKQFIKKMEEGINLAKNGVNPLLPMLLNGGNPIINMQIPNCDIQAPIPVNKNGQYELYRGMMPGIDMLMPQSPADSIRGIQMGQKGLINGHTSGFFGEMLNEMQTSNANTPISTNILGRAREEQIDQNQVSNDRIRSYAQMFQKFLNHIDNSKLKMKVPLCVKCNMGSHDHHHDNHHHHNH